MREGKSWLSGKVKDRKLPPSVVLLGKRGHLLGGGRRPRQSRRFGLFWNNPGLSRQASQRRYLRRLARVSRQRRAKRGSNVQEEYDFLFRRSSRYLLRNVDGS